jgi:hypothetical protein
LSVLQASGASPLALTASAICHLPARELEPIVDEARAVHRLDYRDHLPIAQSPHKPGPHGDARSAFTFAEHRWWVRLALIDARAREAVAGLAR